MRKRVQEDFFERVGVISPNRVHISNHPLDTPRTVFNPALDFNGIDLIIYPRIIVGYYMYVSAIGKMEVPLSDVEDGSINYSHYSAKLVILPQDAFDIWGAEDPRLTKMDDKNLIVYTGRTVNYFDPSKRSWRTSPVVAIEDNGEIKKVAVRKRDEVGVVSDKDAFVLVKDGRAYLFHRPHVIENGEEKFYMAISEIMNWSEIVNANETKEMELSEPIVKIYPEKWEERVGWGTPPIEVAPSTYLALAHALDRTDMAYKAFLILFKLKGGEFELLGTSPGYVMTPITRYEIYGDRPMVVFPTGLVRVDNDVYVAYGAADAVIGLARADLSLLISLASP